MLGTETFALVETCDSLLFIYHELQKKVEKKHKIKILTDSETLFNVIIRNTSTTKRRLMIEIKATSEAFNEVIINNVILIRR